MSKNQEQLKFDLDVDYVVVQNNSLVMGNYDMTTMEQKLFMIMLSTIKKDDTSTKVTSFRVVDLAEIMQITSQVLYRDLKDICKSLMSKVVEVKMANGDWDIFNIISKAEYKKGQGVITLTINKLSEPYLLQLKELFTAFKLDNVLCMDGKYAIRIYQQAKSNIYKGEYIVDINEFKKQLKLTQNSYGKYGNIKAKILIPAIKEINEKTDIDLTVEEIKVGRKVRALKFRTSNKQNQQKVIVNKNKNSPSKSNINGFNNFDGRQYTNKEYNDIEKKLLGWE